MNFEIIMQNLQVGIMIAILGMGVVMIFLTLMMYTMKATDVVMLILGKYFPEEKESEPVKVNIKKTDNDDVAVAIAAAAKHKKLVKGGV